MTASFISILTTLSLDLLPRSLTQHDSIEYGLATTNNGGHLAVLAPVGSPALLGFDAECSEQNGNTLLLGLLNQPNAAALRSHLEWLRLVWTSFVKGQN